MSQYVVNGKTAVGWRIDKLATEEGESQALGLDFLRDYVAFVREKPVAEQIVALLNESEWTSEQPRAAPSDSAPATPGLGPPSAGPLGLAHAALRAALENTNSAGVTGGSGEGAPLRCRACLGRSFIGYGKEQHEPGCWIPLAKAALASGDPRVAPSSPESPAVAAGDTQKNTLRAATRDTSNPEER